MASKSTISDHGGPPAAVSDRDASTRARLAAIVMACGDAIIGETPDGIITDWNPAAERLYGYTADEAIGQLVLLITPPDREEEITGLLAKVRQGETIPGFDSIRLTKDGERLHVSITVFPVRDDDGEIVAIASSARDISALKELEAAQLASEARYRALVDQLPGVVYVLDGDAHQSPLYYSPYLETLTGFTPEEALHRERGAPWWDHVHPDDRERVKEIDAVSVSTRSPFRAEFRTGRADGSYVWVLDDAVPILDESGAITSWQGILIDISDRIAAEDATASLAAIVEGADDAIISTTLDGIVTSWNHGAERVFGYPAAEKMSTPFNPLMTDWRPAMDPGVLHEIADRPLRFEAIRFHRDGTPFHAAMSLSPIRDRLGQIAGISTILRDISAAKQAEEDLRAALETAQAATRTKGLFLAMMSHELRTPLQAVLGYSELLLGGPENSLSPEQREDIAFIHQGAGRMVSLIDQMLDLSRMEAGRLELTSHDLDLPEIMEQVRQDVAPQAAANGLELTMQLPRVLPRVVADPARVRQILLNLVGNAVKFTPEGAIDVQVSETDRELAIAVRDTGIGIPAEALPYIFEEFRQVEGNFTRRYGGAGLGLAISQRLAAQMGGRITVSSQPGAGSTFTLYLPTGRG